MQEENTNARSGIPKIGDRAPDFEAKTTRGPIQFDTWRGSQWVVLFSHPADFTPVCITELIGFARDKAFFDNHDTKLIGVSVDSLTSHLAWIDNVKEKTGVLLDFPIIADLDTSVSRLYGMLHQHESSTDTVRAVFFIDPAGLIRLTMYYPLNIGRSLPEVKRVLEALQTADEQGLACPANWQKGDRAVVPPPKTWEEVEERKRSDYELTDFYLAKTDTI